jgi:peptidoglycan biosynthesis protein MviN/MurJ (putative lipid II flippase)
LIKVQFAMAAISVLVNITLIPVLGVVGAALASSCVNIVGNLWNLYQVRKLLGISPYNRSYYALIVPTGAVAAVLAVLRFSTVSMVHQGLVILMAFAISYTVFGCLAAAYAFDPDDRVIARSVWSKVNDGLHRVGVKPR